MRLTGRCAAHGEKNRKMTDIYGLTPAKLAEKLKELGEKPSRAGIILPAVYGEYLTDLTALPLKKETIEIKVFRSSKR